MGMCNAYKGLAGNKFQYPYFVIVPEIAYQLCDNKQKQYNRN